MGIQYGHCFILLFIYGNVKSSHQLSTSDKNACKSDTGIECCYGYILSKDRSRCEDCPAGLYGNSCSYKCPYGQYGVRCNSKCPKSCSGKLTCDRVEGCTLKNMFRKAKLNASTSERKERSTQLPTENRVTKRHSTAIPEGTSDINTEVLYRSQTREETTRVVYIIYSSSGALALSCILLFILGMFLLFKRLGSSKIVPIYNAEQIYDEIPEDLIPSNVVAKRPVVSPQLLGYYNDNTDVLLSNQDFGNLKGSEPPPYYNEQKEYDFAYQKNNDYYLNPYNTLQPTGYSDHLYHDLKE